MCSRTPSTAKHIGSATSSKRFSNEGEERAKLYHEERKKPPRLYEQLTLAYVYNDGLDQVFFSPLLIL